MDTATPKDIVHVLFVPRPPAAIRTLVTEHLPSGYSLSFASEDDADYSTALAQAEIVIGVPRKKQGSDFFAAAPKLRLLQLLRKGVDKVDAEAARTAGVVVTTIGDLTAPFVAEHTIALMLSLCRNLRGQQEMVDRGAWTEAKPWQKPTGQVDATPFVNFEGVRGRRLGLVGLGSIGSRVATIAKALGMEVQATTRSAPGSLRDGVPLVSLDTLLESSDVVSMHLTLTPETRLLMDAPRFAQMKPGSYFVNTARGMLVDEPALVDALDRRHVTAAALDTLSVEPPPEDHPLLHRPDVIVTPHSAWLSAASWRTVIQFGFENAQQFMGGAAPKFRAF